LLAEHGIGFKVNALRLGDTVLVLTKKQETQTEFMVSAGLLSVKLINRMQSEGNLVAPICSFLINVDSEIQPKELTPFAFKYLEIIAISSNFFITKKDLFVQMLEGIESTGT
jgi:hypothetical protein